MRDMAPILEGIKLLKQQKHELNIQLNNMILKMKKEIETYRKTSIISHSEIFTEDAMYCGWYKCPNCNNTNITDEFKYCPDCGVKIMFSK